MFKVAKLFAKKIFFFTSICETSKLPFWEKPEIKRFPLLSVNGQSVLLNKQGMWVSFKHVVPGMLFSFF